MLNNCFCRFRRCFQVELQADHMVAELKSLIFTSLAPGELNSSFWQVEGFAMPMEDFFDLWKAKDRRTIRSNGFNRKPANFFG